MASRKASGLGEFVRTIVYAGLIAVGIRTFAYEPFNIPSESMLPTLLVGDYLFVSKYSYGYSRHSFPWSQPPFAGRILNSAPERGDVAVFKLPRDNSTDYIKRIIGLPGDRIQVRNSVLHINGKQVPRKRVEDFVLLGRNGNRRAYRQYEETLPSGKHYVTIDMRAGTDGDDTGVFEVPAGHYFAMGDNRDNSLDSRTAPRNGGVGFIPEANLVGRAEFLFFSTDGSARLWEIWRWFQAARIRRFFNGVN